MGRDPGTGKQVQRSVYGDTQKEVRKALSEAVAALDTGNYFEPSKMTLGRWVEIWLQEYMGDKKYLTVKHYKAQCKTHIVPSLGAVKLSELTTPQIQSFYNGLQRNGMAAKSVRNVLGILTKCLSTAVQVGYLRDNPAARVTLPKVIKKEIHPLTDEQVKAFLKAATGDEYEIILKTILFTGLREAEATGLTWDCVDFKRGTILIVKQLRKEQKKDGKYYYSPPKNGISRVLTPAPFVMSILKAHKVRQAEQRLQLGNAWIDSNLVFTNRMGDHLSYRTVYDCFKRIVKKIGVPTARVHDLRHTYAVNALRAGDDIKTLQGNLGHATAAFTLSVYAHFTSEMQHDSAQRMDSFAKKVFNL